MRAVRLFPQLLHVRFLTPASSVGRSDASMLPISSRERVAATSDAHAIPCSTCLLCLCATVCTVFAAWRLLQEPQPFGYDSEGAVWNLRVGQMLGANGTGGERAADALARAQRNCRGAPSRMPNTFDTEVVLSHFLACGSVILRAGLVPFERSEISQMAEFGRAILDEGSSGEWQAGDVLPPPHSDKRGDMWPPFAGSVFGPRLLRMLTSLGPLLIALLGEDVALDFISVLYARSGARAQGWHSEGRDPYREMDGGRLSQCIVKVQVTLVDLEPSQGMIHLLSHSASGLYEQHTPSEALPREHWIVPPRLEAGSVIMYNPKTMHAGGANSLPPHPGRNSHKVVLDIMFKAGYGTDSGDDTPARFCKHTSRRGEDCLVYTKAWGEVWDKWKREHLAEWAPPPPQPVEEGVASTLEL